MIGWLRGQVQGSWQQANRYGVLLQTGGVGYEIQLSRRQFAALPPQGSSLELHIQHTIREDAWLLFGFAERAERDLFRELVAVSGVGPQVALGLLGELEPPQLVQAILQADLRLLAQAPGVGKRTAERLAVELRTRLQQRFADLVAPGPEADALVDPFAAEPVRTLEASARDEVQLTLSALGYEVLEIQRALRAVAALAEPDGPGPEAEAWISACLRWLSRSAT